MAPRLTVAVLLILFLPAFVQAEETFVSIHKVIGNRMSISKSLDGNRARAAWWIVRDDPDRTNEWSRARPREVCWSRREFRSADHRDRPRFGEDHVRDARAADV